MKVARLGKVDVGYARRKFFELADIGKNAGGGSKGKPISPIALEAVERLDALFAIEREINGLTAAERLAVRQQKSKPLFDEMHEWLTTDRATISRSSEVHEPIDYMLKRWSDFARFLDDGRICLTNNAAERALRGIAMRDSLCIPFSSVCKHWKSVRVRSATRAPVTGHRCLRRLRRQIDSTDLIRRTTNNLYGGDNAGVDEASHRVACST